MRKVQSWACALVSGAGICSLATRPSDCAGALMRDAAQGTTAAICERSMGFEGMVTGADLVGDILQQDPPWEPAAN